MKELSQEKPLIIMGIDPGTKVTGYALIESFLGKERVLDFGVIKPPYKYTLHQRYLLIFNGINELIKKFKPHSFAVETQFVKKNVQIALKLGMARGVSLLAASINNLEIFEYAPKKAKLAVVGNGSASKFQVQKMVQVLLKLQSIPEPEDAADAMAIAICHAHNIRLNQGIIKCMNISKVN